MIASTYIAKWNQLPKAVRLFLFKALSILVVWKILYLCVLAPARTLDAPLTYSVGALTAASLNLFTGSKAYNSTSRIHSFKTGNGYGEVDQQAISFHNKVIVGIEDACNGLELFVLYISFIWILPTATGRKVWYTILGVVAIYAINVLRCAMVTYMMIYYPAHADFAHHYVFAFVVYAFIIGLWLAYSNKISFYNETSGQ